MEDVEAALVHHGGAVPLGRGEASPGGRRGCSGGGGGGGRGGPAAEQQQPPDLARRVRHRARPREETGRDRERSGGIGRDRESSAQEGVKWGTGARRKGRP